MQVVKITEEQREVLRQIGKQAYKEMARTLGGGNIRKGKKILAENAAQQGEYGKMGGRPKVYENDPCIIVVRGVKRERPRHRFNKKGKCSCGMTRIAPSTKI